MIQERPTRRHEGGFTLLELLVGMVITLSLVSMIGYAFSSASRTTQKSAQRLDTWREARGALAFMERDLSSVGRFWNLDGGGTTLPPTLVMASSEPGGDEELRFLTYHADGDEPCMVGYRCVWDDDARCYLLQRLSMDREKTRAALGVPHYASTDIVEEEVARYVWDLSFRPVESDGEPAASYPNAVYHSDLPAWVEIRFKVVGEKAVAMLKSLPVTRDTWARPEDPIHRQIIFPNQHQFVIRVRLAVARKLP